MRRTLALLTTLLLTLSLPGVARADSTEITSPDGIFKRGTADHGDKRVRLTAELRPRHPGRNGLVSWEVDVSNSDRRGDFYVSVFRSRVHVYRLPQWDRVRCPNARGKAVSDRSARVSIPRNCLRTGPALPREVRLRWQVVYFQPGGSCEFVYKPGRRSWTRWLGAGAAVATSPDTRGGSSAPVPFGC